MMVGSKRRRVPGHEPVIAGHSLSKVVDTLPIRAPFHRKPHNFMSPESAAPSPSSTNTRRWLLGAVAGAAALSGAGLAWWKGTETHVSDLPADFWQLKFDTPAGQSLGMASLRGQTLLLNFWATWCPPCVEELPLIDGFFQENSKKGWQVLGLAVDQRAAVNGFLAKAPVMFPVALAGMSGVALSKSLGNLGGGLPFTVVIGKDGSVLHRKMGRVTPDDLRVWAQLK